MQELKLGESNMWEGSESFKHVAHVAAGEGSPTDRSRFEETLRKCAATVGIDVKQSVLIVGGSFRDAHSLYRVGFRRMTLSNVEPLVDAEAKTEPMPVMTWCWRTKCCITAARRMPLLLRCCASVAEISS